MSRIKNWVEMATGGTLDIGGTATDEEVQEMRNERNVLREKVKDLQSAVQSQGASSSGAMKMKLKEYKSEIKKLEKEKRKLQANKPMVPPSPPPSNDRAAEIAALEDENEQLKSKFKEIKAKYDKAKADFKESNKDTLARQEDMVSSMAFEMEKLEKANKKGKEAAGALELKVKKLEDLISSLQAQNDSLKSSSSGLFAKLSAIKSQSDAISGDFNKLKTFVGDKMNTEIPMVIEGANGQISNAVKTFVSSLEDLRMNYEKEVRFSFFFFPLIIFSLLT